MSAIPDDIMKLARKAIMAEVRPEVRWQYADGRCDHFAVVQAVAKAIYAERERCSLVAKSHAVLVPVSGVEQWMHVGNSVALAISEEILNSSALAPHLPADDKGRSAEECADRPTEQGGGDD